MMNQTYCLARRQFLNRTANGIGAVAAATLLDPTLLAADAQRLIPERGRLGQPHFVAKAKRVIFLFQAGGPSHIDLFDHKPRLQDEHGQVVPASVLGTQRVTEMTRKTSKQCFGTPFTFSKHGQSGQWFSDRLPHMASTADMWCFVKSVHSEPINHDPAVTFMQTGQQQAGRPSFGAWMDYGLGSDCEDLPAYVVMTGGTPQQPVLSRYWHSGFLPAKYQGVQFQSTGDPVLFLSNPNGIDHSDRGRMIEAVNHLNRIKYEQVLDPEIEARIDSFQMAYRMQSSVPDLVDFSDEPQYILDSYGPDVHQKDRFAYQCLLARRLAERGVRFVQLFHSGWDHHGNLKADITRQTKWADQPTAALVRDLKQRGMLDDTLVVWGGEFGRTAFNQSGTGRDHHPRCFTVGLAGGGIQGGLSYGSTDEYGYNVTQDQVNVRDLHATMLHCLGIDHQRFTHSFQGLDARLTGVEPARVVSDILS